MLGVFVIWRRMAYVGDTLSHSALLGIAIGLLFNLDHSIGVFIAAVSVALLLFVLQQQKQLGNDALLGILAHTGLAVGIIALHLGGAGGQNLEGLLFGDVLAVSWRDIAYIAITAVVVLGLMRWLWEDLFRLTVHSELARVEGVNAVRANLLFVLLVAGFVGAAFKVVGALLVTALLIMPAASARSLSKTPEQMAFFAMLLGVLAVGGGLSASYKIDTPAGPSIVAAAAVLFVLAQFAVAVLRFKRTAKA